MDKQSNGLYFAPSSSNAETSREEPNNRWKKLQPNESGDECNSYSLLQAAFLAFDFGLPTSSWRFQFISAQGTVL